MTSSSRFAQRRALVRLLHDELARTTDRQRLLQFARRWLYEHRLIVLRERELRTMIAKAIRSHEAALARGMHDAVDPLLLAQWHATITQPHDSGATVQSWLWAAPAKHSTRQIEAVLDRIEVLCRLGVDRHLIDVQNVILRRYARRLASRPPAVGARIAEPVRTIEVACFLRYCLLATTDHLLLMVRRRVAELRRLAGLGIEAGSPIGRTCIRICSSNWERSPRLADSQATPCAGSSSRSSKRTAVASPAAVPRSCAIG